MNSSDTLDKLLIYSGLNIRSFSIKIGLDKPQALYDIQKGKTKSISSSMAIKILSVFPEINKIWLLTGEGEMLSNKGQPSSAVDHTARLLSDSDNEDQKIHYTYLLPMRALGGRLALSADSAMIHDCEKIVSPIGKVDFAITISGESMSPEYPNGSQVLVKKINERAFIEWGRVYVLDTVNGPVIKKLMPCKSDHGSVECVSINTEFPPFNVNLSDVYGVYLVLMCLSRK